LCPGTPSVLEVLKGGSFTDVLQRAVALPGIHDKGFNVLKKCGLVEDYAEYETTALRPSTWPIGSDLMHIPIMLFNVTKEFHWKFTPQCEVFPIAKSICMTGFREARTAKEAQRSGFNAKNVKLEKWKADPTCPDVAKYSPTRGET
jgi:hypothetical protein